MLSALTAAQIAIMIASAQCSTGCKHTGYEAGRYSQKDGMCWCADPFNFDEMTRKKKIKLGVKRPKGKFTVENSMNVKEPWHPPIEEPTIEPTRLPFDW